MIKIYSTSSTLTRSLISLILGTVLVIWPEEVNSTIITIIGVLLIFPLIIALTVKVFTKSSTTSPMNIMPLIGGGGSAVLGILMILMPNTFTSLLALFIGVMLFLAGISQIIGVFPYCKTVKSYWSIILPLITLLLGLYAIYNFNKVVKALWIIIGVMIILYGISEIVNYFKLKTLITKNNNVEEAEIIEQ